MLGAGAWVLVTSPPPAPPPVTPPPVVEVPEPPPPPPVPWALGVVRQGEPADLEAKTGALAELLTQEVSASRHLFVVTAFPTTEALVKALGVGEVDFAALGAAPAWEAHRVAGAEVVLAAVRDGEAPQAAAWVNKALFTHGKWDHDGDRKTPKKLRICHLVQTRGRVSSHATLEDAASVGMPFGVLVEDGLLTFGEDAPTDLDGVVGAWSTSYLVGAGPTTRLHDFTGMLAEDARATGPDAAVNALWYAQRGTADVAFADTAAVERATTREGGGWVSELVSIQVRGEYPKRNAEGAPDCYTINSEAYRAEHPERFVLGAVPGEVVVAGKHLEAEARDAGVGALVSVAGADAAAERRAAWSAVTETSSPMAPTETKAQLGALGALLDRLPTAQAP